jgi:hypothetical protein
MYRRPDRSPYINALAEGLMRAPIVASNQMSQRPDRPGPHAALRCWRTEFILLSPHEPDSGTVAANDFHPAFDRLVELEFVRPLYRQILACLLEALIAAAGMGWSATSTQADRAW